MEVHELLTRKEYESWKGVIPEECPYCYDTSVKDGVSFRIFKPLFTNDNLTSLYCKNPRCRGKLISRAENTFKSLGINDISTSTLTGYFERTNHQSSLSPLNHLNVLATFINITHYDLLGHIKNQMQIGRTYGTYVEYLSLPDIGSVARELFSGINSFSDIAYLFSGTVDESVEKIYNYIDSKVSQNLVKRKASIATSLYLFKTELELIDRLFCVEKLETNIFINTMRIATTGPLVLNGVRVGQRDFIAILNHKFPRYRFEWTDAKATCKYIVADFPSESVKYMYGLKTGKLITSTDLFNLLEKEEQ